MDFDPKIYGLAQCAPDLSPVQCYDCLGQLVSVASEQQYQSGRPSGISVFVVWCQLRFSVSPLYEGRAMLQLPAPAPPPEASLAPPTSESGSALKKMERVHCTIFDLPTLQEATEHFSENNKLGDGSSGAVYKGILSDGQEIAVKTLLGGTGHGLHQLHKEVMALAELQHKNLVRLHGFCSHGNETLLVYEFIKNGSLGTFLSGMRIIHQDLKANNILLDDDMEPKIARSGLATLPVAEADAHPRKARAVGTSGYMASEHAKDGSCLSPKIDIFSFGVLALEIVTRRSNCRSDDHGPVNLLTDVWGHWIKGTISQMLHQSLDGYARNQALRCIHIGLLCVQQDPKHRPDASTVVFMLTRDSMELQPPSQPAFFFRRQPPLAASLYDRPDFLLQQGISVNGFTLTDESYPR
ncbi:hypothetical protein U9M48_015471 [Paspalum notatum var. saurae]